MVSIYRFSHVSLKPSLITHLGATSPPPPPQPPTRLLTVASTSQTPCPAVPPLASTRARQPPTRSATGSVSITFSRAAAPALATLSLTPLLRALPLPAALSARTPALVAALTASTTGWITVMIRAWTGSLLARSLGLLRSLTSSGLANRCLMCDV